MNKRLLLCLCTFMLLVTLCSCAKNAPKAIAIDHFLLPESAIPAGWEVYIRDTEMSQTHYQQEEANLAMSRRIGGYSGHFLQEVLFYKYERAAKGGLRIYNMLRKNTDSIPLTEFPELNRLSFTADEWSIFCYEIDNNDHNCVYNGRYGNYVIHVGSTLTIKENSFMTASDFADILKKIDENATKLVKSSTDE